jgi:DNA-binding transcriptional regulator YiaG
LAWDIETTDEFQAWWTGLSEAEREAITIGVRVLKKKGTGARKAARGYAGKRFEASKPEGIARSICRQTVPNLFCVRPTSDWNSVDLICGGDHFCSPVFARLNSANYLPGRTEEGGTSLMARMKFSELAKQTMTPEAIARSQKAAMKESAAMELAELRDTLKLTQADLAGRIKVSQAAISKLEKRNRNIHVDQLRSIVSAMGGNLIIIADFNGRKVELSHIGNAGDSCVKKAGRHETGAAKGRQLRTKSA